MAYDLTISVHKGTCSSAHLGHNRRTIDVLHSDKNRQHLNKCYIDMELSEAYRILFDNALEEYNADKKPSRQIKDYLAHITEQYEKGEQKLQEAKSRGASRKELAKIKSRYPKPFYELIVSVGNCDAYGGIFASGGEKEEIVVDVLNDYVKDFYERNPYLFVFSAHLHRDEKGVPHIHMDYIPWTDEQGRGLPIRVSENGAFKQQGLTTGQTGDIGSIAFQNQERAVLTEIARRHDINIIEGKHSKKHLSKEEYILRQEQERCKEDAKHIDQEAGVLLEEQDKFLDFVQKSDYANLYVEHLDNEKLRKKFSKQEEAIANAWEEFNQSTSLYFSHYRRQKALLREELEKARKSAYYNKKTLYNLLYDIACTNDLLITKLFKLIGAIFIALNNIFLEAEVQRLQSANNQLKQLAKDIMSDSQNVSAELKTKDINRIENALAVYDKELNYSINRINYLTHNHPETLDR